jgi:alpha-galactosidase
LWWNDPDAVLLTGDLSEEAFRFHATAIYATGGMILSGDDLTKISADRLTMLLKLQPPTGQAARFADDSLRVGTIKLPDKDIFCLFNWDDAPRKISFGLSRSRRVTDFWSGQDLGRHSGEFSLDHMPARTARLLVCTPDGKDK